MCVIIIKPANAAMPTIEELQNAYSCNPDGCGFVSENHSYKGLNFETFLKELSKVGEDERCIIHFRLATHGSIKKSNCHPFYAGGIYFAHNGTLRVEPEGDKTDSETVFRNILLPIIESRGLESKELKCAVNAVIGSSKFALMHKGKIYTFGSFTKHDGRYYSNTRHIPQLSCFNSITWDNYLSMR